MFGSTYNGQFEDVKAFSDKVGELFFCCCASDLHMILPLVLPKLLVLSLFGCALLHKCIGTHPVI